IENYRVEKAIPKLISGDASLEDYKRDHAKSPIVGVSKERKEILIKTLKPGGFKILAEGGKDRGSFDIFERSRAKKDDPRYLWFRDIDAAARDTVSRRSNKETSFVYCGTIEGDEVRFQIGRETASVSRTDVLAFLDSGTVPKQIQNLFQPGISYVLTRTLLE